MEPDGLHPRMPGELADALMLFCTIFEKIMEVPDDWRKGNVASFFKEGQSALVQSEENYGTVLMKCWLYEDNSE